MKPVYSSHIDKIGYDPDTQVLSVLYKNGKTAHFQGVPAETADDVVNAPSVGSALHQHIRGKYEHSYE